MSLNLLRRLALPIAVTALGACSASRALAPLDKGQHGITASFGGPFVEFAGAPVPLPISSIGWRYGIDGLTDVHAAFYPSGLALLGVGGVDVGIARELLAPQGARPRIMLDFTTYWFGGTNRPGDPPGGFRFFPDIALIATWELGARPHRIYVGIDTFIQPFPELYVMPTPLLGTELRATKAFGIQIELGWNAFWQNTTRLVPNWYGPGNLGAVSAKLGFNIDLPQKKSSFPEDAQVEPRRAAPLDLPEATETEADLAPPETPTSGARGEPQPPDPTVPTEEPTP